ncbi:hypothetical protein BDW60DRAFT_173386 [Aspergillus nidulans var. acristatus]
MDSVRITTPKQRQICFLCLGIPDLLLKIAFWNTRAWLTYKTLPMETRQPLLARQRRDMCCLGWEAAATEVSYP